MTKRWLLNGALALFVIALALIVEFQRGRSPDPVDSALTQLQAEAIQEIRLARPGEPEIRLQRAGQDWRLTAPVKARADRFRVDGLLHLTAAGVKTRFPASGDLSQYGLAPPTASVWLDGSEIRVGGQHALNDQRYVLFDNQVALVPGVSARAVTTPLSDFFSARLIEENRKPIALRFARFSLKLDNGTWKVQPGNKDLSTDAVNAFADQWRYARALSVTRYSGKPITGRVSVSYIEEDADKHTATAPQNLDLAILARKPEFVIYRPDEGLEYHFPQETGERLLTLAPQE